MKRIIYIIFLGLIAGMISCSSPEKEADQDQQVPQAQSQDEGRKRLAEESRKPTRPSTPTQAISNPELDEKSLKGFIQDEMLLEVLEIGDPGKIKKKTNKDGDLIITWPNMENQGEKLEMTFSRGEAFRGTMDNMRELAASGEMTFFDDIGYLGGYYEGGEESKFSFPIGGYMYSFKLPDIFPDDLKAEKGHQLALKIWEANQ